MNDLIARLERAEDMAAQLRESCAVQEQRATSAVFPEEKILSSLDRLRETLSLHDAEVQAARTALQALEQEHAGRGERLLAAFESFWTQVPAMMADEVNARVAAIERDLRAQLQKLDQERQDAFAKAVESGVQAKTRDFEAALDLHRAALAQLTENSNTTRAHLSTLLESIGALTAEVEKARAVAPVALVPPKLKTETPAKQEVPLFAAVPKTSPFAWLRKLIWPLLAALLVVLVAIAGWQFAKGVLGESVTAAANGSSQRPSPVVEAKLLDRARDAAAHQDYAKAEDLYREAMRVAPKSEDAIQGLSDTLLHEGKLAQSAAVLKLLPANGAAPDSVKR